MINATCLTQRPDCNFIIAYRKNLSTLFRPIYLFIEIFVFSINDKTRFLTDRSFRADDSDIGRAVDQFREPLVFVVKKTLFLIIILQQTFQHPNLFIHSLSVVGFLNEYALVVFFKQPV